MVWRYRTDLLLLPAGRRACRRCATAFARPRILPPHRIVPLHLYRVGRWYPFRDYQATIADPKTTACVGAMLCLLGEGQLQNFNFRSDELKPQSTARFFGKLDRNNRLLKADEYYDNLDLDDPDYELPDTAFDFRGPMPLGFRQFPVDWWPSTRLYSLDYANQEMAAKLNPKTPLRIKLKRNTGRERARRHRLAADRRHRGPGRAQRAQQQHAAEAADDRQSAGLLARHRHPAR